MPLTRFERHPHDDVAPTVPEWLLRHRALLIWAFHMTLAVASSYLALLVRFDGAIPLRYVGLWRNTLAALLVIRGTMFVAFRLYEGLWRYTGVHDALKILASVGVGSVMFRLLMQRVAYYPPSILVIDALLLAAFAIGVRLMARAQRSLLGTKGGRKILIYGAGDAGEAVVREMRLSLSREYDPVGFVDDDRSKVGLRIHGVSVLGTRRDLAEIVRRYRPEEVVVTIPRADPPTYRDVVRALEPFQLPIKTLPHLREILNGRVSTSLIRDLSLEDLLRRAPVGLSQGPLLGLIAGKTILVTGAGGSIGSELCRQIAALDPASLVLYERHENSLYAVMQDLIGKGVKTGLLHPVLGDITDRDHFKSVLQSHCPDIIFHAAAHKHVPLVEHNVCEAVKNNVIGTRIAVELAEECGVRHFVLISTDKAVNPCSVMGATKRIAELMLQARTSRNRTAFVTVRFGNVLGSNGSVIPLFMDQLKHGGPLTVTHPDVQRYFMLIPEAVQLVLHAAAIGEPHSIYVLDMGEPVRLVDVARDLIRLSGFRVDDVPITFIGLREGEKLDEQLVGEDEISQPSPVESIMQVRPRRPPDPASLATLLTGLERSARMGDAAAVTAQLHAIIPEFRTTAGPGDAPVAAPAAVNLETGPAFEVGALPAAATCSACAAAGLRRSRVHGPLESVRRRLTPRRPYRCDACGWRGWINVVDTTAPPPGAGDTSRPDLAALDAAFRPITRPQAPSPDRASLAVLDDLWASDTVTCDRRMMGAPRSA